VVSGDIGIYKPDRRIFDEAISRAGVKNEEAMFVGDHPVNDIEGARGAGWKTLWMKSTGYWAEGIAPADREVYKVNEIIDVILSLEE
jgi:putative hydrolase of the HAD superfamily